MGKVFKGFRFDAELYGEFKAVARESGLMVTEAFEKFMSACVEAEARVLLAWLRKGQVWYASPDGEEVSVHGKLLQTLSQLENEDLQKEIEEELKKS